MHEALTDELYELLWGQERNPVPTAVDHAYEMIWKQLVGGGMGIGLARQRLSDVVLAEQLGLSRTPVRQALHRLTHDGLVEFDPRRGFWLRSFTDRDIHEIYDLRSALEVLALRLAAHSLDPVDLHGHLAVLRGVRADLGAHSLVPFLQSDLSLHNLLIRASGNQRLIRFLSLLRSQLSFFQVKDAPYPQRMQIALDDHEHILESLLAGDVDEAATCLATHIAHAKAGVLDDLFAEPMGVPSAGEGQAAESAHR